jgi:hypothetical protein
VRERTGEERCGRGEKKSGERVKGRRAALEGWCERGETGGAIKWRRAKKEAEMSVAKEEGREIERFQEERGGEGRRALRDLEEWLREVRGEDLARILTLTFPCSVSLQLRWRASPSSLGMGIVNLQL